MFRPIRRLLAALRAISDELRAVGVELSDLSANVKAQGPPIERMEALELSRHQWEATCEGLLQKAEGKLRAANNAEARERANKKSYEHLFDPLAEIGDEPEPSPGDTDNGNNAPPGEAEGVQPLRLDVAPSAKTLAQRRKFGVMNR